MSAGKLVFNVELPEKIGGKKLTRAQADELSELKKLIKGLESVMTQKRMESIGWMSINVSDMKGKAYSVRAWVGKRKESWS